MVFGKGSEIKIRGAIKFKVIRVQSKVDGPRGLHTLIVKVDGPKG